MNWCVVKALKNWSIKGSIVRRGVCSGQTSKVVLQFNCWPYSSFPGVPWSISKGLRTWFPTFHRVRSLESKQVFRCQSRSKLVPQNSVNLTQSTGFDGSRRGFLCWLCARQVLSTTPFASETAQNQGPLFVVSLGPSNTDMSLKIELDSWPYLHPVCDQSGLESTSEQSHHSVFLDHVSHHIHVAVRWNYAHRVQRVCSSVIKKPNDFLSSDFESETRKVRDSSRVRF